MRKKAAPQEKRPLGRPRRTDSPKRLTVNLPGELRHWLKIHAATVERDMGDIVADALSAFRERLARTRK